MQISANVPYNKSLQMKSVRVIFLHPNFLKNSITLLDVSSGVNIRSCVFEAIAHFRFYCNFCTHNLIR